MGRTFVVGISGASASGKSTISEHLKQLLENDYKVQLIHMDEYYKEETYRPKIYGISDGMEYIDDNHPMALDLDQCYLDVQKAIEEFDVLIIEGLLRNLSFGQHLGEITSRYVQAVQPRQKEYVEPTKWKADIILNGFLQTSKGVEIIVNWIYQQLSYNK